MASLASSFVVGGVPEPMNLPWLLSIADGTFADAGIAVEWIDQPGGTGAIAKALTDRRLDVATILTEGAVAAIVNGADLRICSLWMPSPLLWGIHIAGHSTARTIHDIEPVRFAVSRLGSGSHLMAYLLAARDGFQLAPAQLVVVGDIDGARAALREDRADVFLWEKYVTSPLVHSGEFRRLDVIATPWPSFAIAVHTTTLTARAYELDRLIVTAQQAAGRFSRDPDAGAVVMAHYGLTTRDAAEWLAGCRFATTTGVAPHVVDDIQRRLLEVKAITSTRPAADIVT
jgi:ABC-type nitrate/sulfonate/bicarbonate transport system substrate-binding protein